MKVSWFFVYLFHVVSSAFWLRWREWKRRQATNAHYVAQLLTGTYGCEAKREGAKDTELIRKLPDSIPRDSWLEKQVVSFASFHLAHFWRADWTDLTGDMLLAW